MVEHDGLKECLELTVHVFQVLSVAEDILT